VQAEVDDEFLGAITTTNASDVWLPEYRNDYDDWTWSGLTRRILTSPDGDIVETE